MFLAVWDWICKDFKKNSKKSPGFSEWFTFLNPHVSWICGWLVYLLPIWPLDFVYFTCDMFASHDPDRHIHWNLKIRDRKQNELLILPLGAYPDHNTLALVLAFHLIYKRWSKFGFLGSKFDSSLQFLRLKVIKYLFFHELAGGFLKIYWAIPPNSFS